MSNHIHVVVNPESGQNKPILNTLNDVFHPSGVTWSASVTNAYGDAIKQAREAAEGGDDIGAGSEPFKPEEEFDDVVLE